MKLVHRDADALDGNYGPPQEQATISGKVAGGRFTFTYSEPTGAKGEGWFELSRDGNEFHGRWRENGQEAWGDWDGKRTSPLASTTFTGLWKASYGPMRLWQDGTKVHGIYEFNGRSTVTGEVTGNTLHFRYEQPDGEKGDGQFVLSNDHNTFSGTWSSAQSPAGKSVGGGKWEGTRVIPQPGRVWLVVLEAPWEADLQENEYSFGLMLRTFFARTPDVQVRHKFFHSEMDLRHWCGELTYLAEPVVLHISSHGTAQGVSVGAETIGAAALADCVRDADNLKLLHFGACMVAGGDVPKKMFEILGPSAHFPISGYRNAADWAGSAVVDFTYLDLILSRGMAPAEAAKQTSKMLSFARDAQTHGDAIGPTGFLLVEPPVGSAPSVVGKQGAN